MYNVTLPYDSNCSILCLTNENLSDKKIQKINTLDIPHFREYSKACTIIIKVTNPKLYYDSILPVSLSKEIRKDLYYSNINISTYDALKLLFTIINTYSGVMDSVSYLNKIHITDYSLLKKYNKIVDIYFDYSIELLGAINISLEIQNFAIIKVTYSLNS